MEGERFGAALECARPGVPRRWAGHLDDRTAHALAIRARLCPHAQSCTWAARVTTKLPLVTSSPGRPRFTVRTRYEYRPGVRRLRRPPSSQVVGGASRGTKVQASNICPPDGAGPLKIFTRWYAACRSGRQRRTAVTTRSSFPRVAPGRDED